MFRRGYFSASYGAVSSAVRSVAASLNLGTRRGLIAAALLLTGVAHAQTITTIAGKLGTPGYTGDSGPASAATFYGAYDTVTDAAGNIYISDTGNHVIRKIDAITNNISTYVPKGAIALPTGLAIDKAGNLYVADPAASLVYKIDATTHAPSVVAGSYTLAGSTVIPSIGYSGDGGAATSAQLNFPTAVAVDASGNLFIADTKNNFIREVSGGIITTLVGADAKLNRPTGVAVDSTGALYIGDAENFVVKKFSGGNLTTLDATKTAELTPPPQQLIGSPFASISTLPLEVKVDAYDNLYITDYPTNAVRQVNAITGAITTVAGSGGPNYANNVPATQTGFQYPSGVSFSPTGTMYVIDLNDLVLRQVIGIPMNPADATATTLTPTGTIFTPNSSFGITVTVTDLAATPQGTPSGSVTLTDTCTCGSTTLNGGQPVALSGGTVTLYGVVLPIGTHTITATYPGVSKVFQASSNSITINVVAAPTQITLSVPSTVTAGIPFIATIKALDNTGAVLTSWQGSLNLSATVTGPLSANDSYSTGPDTGLSPKTVVFTNGIATPSVMVGAVGTHSLFAYDPTTSLSASSAPFIAELNAPGTITTVAGNGTAGYLATDDGKSATKAELNDPNAVAVDGYGVLYIADEANHRIRRVSGGIISTYAGLADGYCQTIPGRLATAADLCFPLGVAVNLSGDVFVVDRQNAVWKIDASTKIITRYAGGGAPASGNGDGGQATDATFSNATAIAVSAQGVLYVVDSTVIRSVDPSTHIITTVAGGGTATPTDGAVATTEQFFNLTGVATDNSGNVYFSNTCQIFKLSGTTATRIFGNYDSNNGCSYSFENQDYRLATDAYFAVAGLTVDAGGNVYFTSPEGSVEKISAADGMLTNVAGSPGSFYSSVGDNGPATQAGLQSPVGIMADGAGNLYIADAADQRVRKVTFNASGPSPNVTWQTPAPQTLSVSLDDSILNATADVPGTFTYVPASGTTFGVGTWQLAVTFVPSNSYYANVEKTVTLQVNKIMPVIYWNQPADVAAGTVLGDAQLNAVVANSVPGTLTYTPAAGTVLTANTQTLSVTFTPSDPNYAVVTQTVPIAVIATASTDPQISTVAGNGQSEGPHNDDGNVATAAELLGPGKVVFDHSGNMYIADTYNNLIRKVAAGTKIISTVAGVSLPQGGGQQGYDPTQEGGPATSAYLNGPRSVGIDSLGNLYIADTQNQRIRKVDATSGAITTIIGTGANASYIPGDLSGPALSANLQIVTGITLDSHDNLYFSDCIDGRVMKMAAGTSTLVTVAGIGNSASYSTAEEGAPATQANLNCPYGLAVNAAGDLYIADENNGLVRKVAATTQAITTVAGTTTPANYNQPQDGSLATAVLLNSPIDVALDSVGNLYIADLYNNRIRKVTPAGIFSTLAGNGNSTYTVSLDNGPARVADIGIPQGLGLDAAGNVYIADSNYQRIRMVGPARKAPVVTWAAPAAIDTATPLSATQLNATADVPGTFAYTPAAGTLLTAGPQTLSVLFTPTDTTTYVNASATVNITVKTAPVITWATPASIPYGTALGAAQLNATANTPGTFLYTPMGGTQLAVGPQTLTVTFTPTDTTTYSSVKATVQLTVTAATPVVTWATPAPIDAATPLSTVQLNATASTPGSFTYTPAAGTVLSGGMHSLSVLFTPTDTTSYTTATATVNIMVKTAPVITWSTPASVPYGTALSATQLNATANIPGTFVYSPAAGTKLSVGSQTLTATFTPTDTATYSSTTTTVQLAVTAATPVITWATPAAIAPATPLSATQLNATANVPGTFTYTPAAGTILSGGPHSLSVLFTPTDTTSYTTATATVNLTVKIAPVITWTTPVSILYGTALSATQLNATANVPGAFVYSPAAGTVLGAGPQTLSATFTPTDPATYTSATATVQLTVTSVPIISLSSSSLTFALQTEGTTSAAQTVTVTNTGTAALTITSLTASGDFAQTNTCGSSLAANSSCTINVTFTPTATGTRTGAVTLTDDAAGTPHNVPLTGTAAGVAVTSSATSLNITSPGGSATTTLTFTSANGFSGTTALSCAITYTGTGTASNAPTCTLTPPSLTIAAGGSATAILTVNSSPVVSSVTPLKLFGKTGATLAVLLFAGLLPRRRRTARLLLPLIGFVVLGAAMGCSTGSSATPSAGTTVGSYQVVVTATSGSTTAKTTLPISVQ